MLLPFDHYVQRPIMAGKARNTADVCRISGANIFAVMAAQFGWHRFLNELDILALAELAEEDQAEALLQLWLWQCRRGGPAEKVYKHVLKGYLEGTLEPETHHHLMAALRGWRARAAGDDVDPDDLVRI